MDVIITGTAADKITQVKEGVDKGNIFLQENLEKGATYRLTVDFSGVTVTGNSINGKETVRFDKL